MPRLAMRFASILLVVIAIAACSGAETKKLAFNRYVLETPYGGDIALDVALARLDREANGLCDRGYRKVNDFDTTKGGRRLVVWEVQCKGVSRADSLATSTPPPPK